MTISFDPAGQLLLHRGQSTLVCAGAEGAAGAAGAAGELEAALASDQPVRDVIDLLTRDGLAATPAFALVHWAGSDTDRAIVVVRGSIPVTVTTGSSSTTLDGSDVATWREVVFERVSAIAIGGQGAFAGAGAAGGERAQSASVTETRATETSAAEPATTETPATAPSATSAPVTAPTPLPENTITELAEPEATAETETKTGSATDGAAATDSAAGIDSAAGADSAAGTAAANDGSADDEYAHLFGVTIVRSVEEAAVRPASDEDAEGGSELGDHDGMTIVSGDLAKLRARAKGSGDASEATAASPIIPPAPRATASPAAPLAATIVLDLSTGAREPLTQTVVIGRSPSATKVSSGQVPRLVTITGDQDISRNHAQFSLQGGTVVVTDLHSRNGTSVILPGKSPQRLREGEPTPVLVGTVVDLGGGITVTVREA